MKKKRDKKTKAEVEWVIGMMEKYGSLDYSQKLAEKFSLQAKKVFDQKLDFLSCQPARKQIMMAIDFIIERKY